VKRRPQAAEQPRARKRFGQHFLEPAWVAKVVGLIDPAPADVFIEIGPGRGALTRPLAARSRAVIAFEIDRDLVRELQATVPPNVTVVEGDFLNHHASVFSANPDGDLRVAANLPYNVASPILFKLIRLFDAGVPIKDVTVMLQREVADRLLAQPGSKDYGVLTVLVRHSATAVRLLNLPPGAFRPPPQVQSSVVRLTLHTPEPPARNRDVFAALVQAVFTRRRKTIGNALMAFTPARGQPLPSWLDRSRRPETLSIEEFVRLADEFAT
jgi:16S rRNA (adenine1518-N6/adenine1519-N6)-dimethyltransferase